MRSALPHAAANVATFSRRFCAPRGVTPAARAAPATDPTRSSATRKPASHAGASLIIPPQAFLPERDRGGEPPDKVRGWRGKSAKTRMVEGQATDSTPHRTNIRPASTSFSRLPRRHHPRPRRAKPRIALPPLESRRIIHPCPADATRTLPVRASASRKGCSQSGTDFRTAIKPVSTHGRFA